MVGHQYCTTTILLTITTTFSLIASAPARADTPPSPCGGARITLPLIHRDSPLSPLHRPNATLHDVILRGLYRAKHRLGQNLTAVSYGGASEVFPDMGQYVLKLSVGTPPFDVYGIVDTGSDLFWTQCVPCDKCYNQSRPKFDPAASSSYANLECKSDQCRLLETATCSAGPVSNLCNYSYGYASASLTQGYLATDTMTLQSAETKNPLALPNIVFGCGHNNTGPYNPNEMGIIGLGRGPVSFVSQMAPLLGGRKIFSHCLVPFHTDPHTASKITFGSGSEVAGPGVITTPMFITDQTPPQDPTYYFVTLLGISVGNVYMPFSGSGATVAKGNMFLDSGTPPTIVPRDFYNRLESEVRKAVPSEITPITDPTLGPQLCYGPAVQEKGPVLSARFDRNVEVVLKQKSVFISPKPGIFCFAFVPTDSNGGIFGNFAQTDYLIGFDVDAKTVSFKPTDCTKYT